MSFFDFKLIVKEEGTVQEFSSLPARSPTASCLLQWRHGILPPCAHICIEIPEEPVSFLLPFDFVLVFS